MSLLGLLFPLIILTVVSITASVIFLGFGIKFWLSFVIATLAQIIIYNVFRAILDAVVILKDKKLENERIKEFSYQGLEVTCPCNKKHIDFVPIRLNTPNMYKCGECDKSVSVYINAETALQTEPINNTDITEAVAPILKNIANGNS
jgi:uncharacterized protein (UPF0212 family)